SLSAAPPSAPPPRRRHDAQRSRTTWRAGDPASNHLWDRLLVEVVRHQSLYADRRAKCARCPTGPPVLLGGFRAHLGEQLRRLQDLPEKGRRSVGARSWPSYGSKKRAGDVCGATEALSYKAATPAEAAERSTPRQASLRPAEGKIMDTISEAGSGTPFK